MRIVVTLVILIVSLDVENFKSDYMLNSVFSV